MWSVWGADICDLTVLPVGLPGLDGAGHQLQGVEPGEVLEAEVTAGTPMLDGGVKRLLGPHLLKAEGER